MPELETPNRKRLWYRGWTIVGVCVLVQAMTLGLAINCFSLFLPLWSKEFAVPVSVLTLGITIFSLVCGVLGPFVGLLADRKPARLLFACSLGSLAVFHFVTAQAQTALQIVLLYAIPLPFIITIGSSITAQALVSRWFTRKSGLALGLSAFGLGAAGVAFPPIVVRLTPLVQWQGVWMIFGGIIALVVIPIVLLLVRDRPISADGDAYLLPAGGHDTEAPASAPRFLSILKSRNFQIMMLAFFPLQATHMGVVVNLAPMALSRGLVPADAGLLLSLLATAALVSKLASGMLADRFGVKGPVVGVTLFAGAGTLCLAFAQDNFALMCAGVVLVGLNGGMWTLVAASVAREFGSATFGKAFGVASIFAAVSGALAPPIIARMQEATGTYTPGLVGLCVLVLLGGAQAVQLTQANQQRF